MRKLSAAVIGILIASLAIESGFYFSLQSNYNALKTEYFSLQSDYSMLKLNYSRLKGVLDELQEQHALLKSQYELLSQKYSTLQAEYDLLKVNFDSYRISYEWLINQVNVRLGVKWGEVERLITPDDSYVRNVVMNITLGWSGFGYDWNEFWSDIETMYHWIVANIEYRSDGLYPYLPSNPNGTIEWIDDMWQFPRETIKIRKGDCEDMAILLTTMIRHYTKRTVNVYVIIIVGENWAHAGVIIPVQGGYISILDPAGKYYTKNWLGKLTQKRVDQEIYNWINYWGGKRQVKIIFNDEEYLTFKSTDDFITWIYNTTIKTTPRKP